MLLRDVQHFQTQVNTLVQHIRDYDARLEVEKLLKQFKEQAMSLVDIEDADVTPEHRESIAATVSALSELIEEYGDEMPPTISSPLEASSSEPEISNINSSTESKATPSVYLARHAPDPSNLLVLDLKVKNYQFGQPVQRATDITKDNVDDWIVRYSLKEIEDPAIKIKHYVAMQKRRLRLVRSEKKWDVSPIAQTMRLLAKAGKKYRAERDKMNEEQGIEIFKPFVNNVGGL